MRVGAKPASLAAYAGATPRPDTVAPVMMLFASRSLLFTKGKRVNAQQRAGPWGGWGLLQGPGARRQVSGVRCQVSGVGCQPRLPDACS